MREGGFFNCDGMKGLERKIQIAYEVHPDKHSLPQDEAELLDKALEATHNSYAPFSGFHVGCAVLLEGGEIVLGNNQENIALPSGMCAERSALYHIGGLGKAPLIRKIAIRARSTKIEVEEPVTPCGACRQVMAEYEKMTQQPYIVLMQGTDGAILRLNGVCDSLMPFSFAIQFLGKSGVEGS